MTQPETSPAPPAPPAPPPLMGTRAVLRAALWSVLDVDARLRHTLAAVARAPERVTREWLGGNAQGHFPPFKLLVVATFITFLFTFVGTGQPAPVAGAENAVSLDARGAEMQLTGPQDANPALQAILASAAKWVQAHPDLINLGQMFLLLASVSLACRLLFARSGVRYGHWLVLHTYVAGAYFFFLLPLSVAEFIWPDQGWLRLFTACVSFLLHGWAGVRMLGRATPARVAAMAGALAVSLVLWFVLLGVVLITAFLIAVAFAE